MQRRSPAFYRKRSAKQQIRFNVNRQIRAPRVAVIDEAGQNLGELETARALALAEERGYDLVEVQPKTAPPVCRFLDYGQFQYEQEKHRQKQKVRQKKVMTKGVRLSLRIGEHDKSIRQAQARKFLEQGHKVKIDMVLRGREKGHTEAAQKIMREFARDLGEEVFIEQPFTKQGGRLSLVVAKKSSN